MKRVWLLAGGGLLLGIVVLGVLFARSQSPNSNEAPGQDAGLPAKTPVHDASPPGVQAGLPVNGDKGGGAALLGSVVAPTQTSLSVRIPARIVQVYVKEGDMVRAGQPLIDLDESEMVTQERTAQAGVDAARAQVKKAQVGTTAQQVKADADVNTARSALTQAQTKLQQATLARQAAEDDQKAELKTAQEGVRKAEAALQRAQETLRGLEELAKIGGVSRSDLAGARTQATVAQSDLDTAKTQAERLNAGQNGLPYRVELAQKDEDAARAGVQQAREGLKSAEEGRRQTLLVSRQDVQSAFAGLSQALAGLTGVRDARRQAHLSSPISGLATAVPARTGETAQPGVPLATIVSLVGLRVEALVTARMLATLRAGQSATVAVDTLPGRKIAAVVSDISRIAEPDGRTFRVKFRLLESPILRPGQTARIRLSSHQ